MKPNQSIGLASAVIATTVAISAAGSNETIEDDVFEEVDWFVVELRDETLGDSAGFVGVQQSTGGNPAEHRFVANSWTHDGNGSVSVVGGHLRVAAEYQPSAQGEVGTLDFSFDVRTTATTYQTESLLLFLPLLMQNDAYYTARVGAEAADLWASFASGELTAEDFTRYAGDPQAPSTPDFSAQGSPLTFGFATSVGPHALAGTYATDGGLDNFTVSVREPAGGAGGGGGAGGSASASGGSSSQGSGTLPSGQPGAVVPRVDSGCGCRLGTADDRGHRRHAWWLLAAGAIFATTTGRRRGRRPIG